jgi:hypothetical protein
VVTLFSVAAFSISASAATFAVNVSSDEVDAAPGNGVCATPTGHCTLRAAVMEANALSGEDKIVLTTDVFLECDGCSPFLDENDAGVGDLDITDDLEIVGSSRDLPTVSTSGFRIFDIISTVRVRLSYLAIQGAHVFDAGGAIRNDGSSLSISGVLITGNGAQQGGGGILNTGKLDIRDSVVHGNFGGTQGSAGGIENLGGELHITRTQITNNSAEALGGGASNLRNSGEAFIVDSTIAGNTTFGGPAGLFNAGQMTLLRSTISGNWGAYGNGGVENHGFLRIINSTISGNSAWVGAGGIDNYGTLWLVFSTVTGNRIAHGKHTAVANFGTAYVQSSIIAGNISSIESPQPDCAGTFISLGNNIIGEVGDLCSGFTDLTDRVGTIAAPLDPLLGPLEDNGGFTFTHALQEGSPAIDAVLPADCFYDQDGDPRTPDRPLRTDQRMRPRPVGGLCDVGAYEFGRGQRRK